MSKYYMGQGKVYAAVRGETGIAGGYRFLGNCARLDISLGRAGMARADKGAASQPLVRVPGSDPSFTLDMESIEKENLALVLHGENTDVAADTEDEIQIVARKGMMVPLPHINITAFTSLKSADNTITYPAGSYTVDLAAGCIEFAATSTIPDNTVVKAKYTHAGHTFTGVYTNRPEFIALRFQGINTADNNAPVVVDLFKTKFDPVDSLPLINDNFLVLATKGKLYQDDTIFAGAPEGKFLRIRQTS